MVNSIGPKKTSIEPSPQVRRSSDRGIQAQAREKKIKEEISMGQRDHLLLSSEAKKAMGELPKREAYTGSTPVLKTPYTAQVQHIAYAHEVGQSVLMDTTKTPKEVMDVLPEGVDLTYALNFYSKGDGTYGMKAGENTAMLLRSEDQAQLGSGRKCTAQDIRGLCTLFTQDGLRVTTKLRGDGLFFSLYTGAKRLGLLIKGNDQFAALLQTFPSLTSVITGKKEEPVEPIQRRPVTALVPVKRTSEEHMVEKATPAQQKIRSAEKHASHVDSEADQDILRLEQLMGARAVREAIFQKGVHNNTSLKDALRLMVLPKGEALVQAIRGLYLSMKSTLAQKSPSSLYLQRIGQALKETFGIKDIEKQRSMIGRILKELRGYIFPADQMQQKKDTPRVVDAEFVDIPGRVPYASKNASEEQENTPAVPQIKGWFADKVRRTLRRWFG